jgi:hypothetical protein
MYEPLLPLPRFTVIYYKSMTAINLAVLPTFTNQNDEYKIFSKCVVVGLYAFDILQPAHP